MTITSKRILTTCAAFGFAAFSLLATAQDSHSDSCKNQPNPQDCMQAKMQQYRAAHEAKLHDALKLTAAQEPAWKTFIDSTNQQMDAMAAEHKNMPARADVDKMSLPDRLNQHLTMEQKHLSMMQSQLATLKTFYATLTPDQQAVMDKEIKRFMQRHHHGSHGWGGEHSGDMHSPMP